MSDVVLFDDFDLTTYDGVTKAIEYVRKEREEDAERVEYLHNRCETVLIALRKEMAARVYEVRYLD